MSNKAKFTKINANPLKVALCLGPGAPELRVLMRYFAILFIGLHGAAPDGTLLRYWRRYRSGSRDWECRVGLNLEAGLPLFFAPEQTGSEHFARRVERATARATRNGRPASKAKMTHHASGETSN
jgi:hypothetical protein